MSEQVPIYPLENDHHEVLQISTVLARVGLPFFFCMSRISRSWMSLSWISRSWISLFKHPQLLLVRSNSYQTLDPSP